MKNAFLLITASLLAFAGSASAQVTLYQDFTTTSGGLSGQPPTDKLNTNGDLLNTSGGTAATWVADSAWTSTGSSASTGTSGGSNAFLPFTPTPGDNYTLSATLTVLSGSLNWLGLGFTSADSTNSYFYDGTHVNPAPWMVLTPGSSPDAYLYGSGTTPTAITSAFQGDTFKLTLDTFANPATAWTYSLTATGPGITGPLPLELGSGTYTTNPSISYIGFGAYIANGEVSNFTLTDLTLSVPEPSTYMLFGLGGLVLFMARRLRAQRRV